MSPDSEKGIRGKCRERGGMLCRIMEAVVAHFTKNGETPDPQPKEWTVTIDGTGHKVKDGETLTVEAVSYTHLDVYKRQSLLCWLWCQAAGVAIARHSYWNKFPQTCSKVGKACLLYTSRCV